MKTCHIHGLGTYVPARILTNADLTAIVDTSDEWITSRTGIQQRHMLAEGENASDAGFMAAKQALDEANLDPKDVTHLFLGTCTQDQLCPSVACIVAGKLGCGSVMALDFNAACSGFIYGLELAQAIVRTQPDAVVLLVCAEALTRRLNWGDRSTCVLFGDGAGAMVLRGQASTKGQVVDTLCASDGNLHNLISVGGGTAKRYEVGQGVDESFFLQMQGREVFKYAVRNMVAVCQNILGRNGLDITDVSLLVPHQANMRIIEAVGSRLEIPVERVFANVASYGNTSSASVPLALADARAQGRLALGDRVLATSFGGGLTWGAALLQF